MHIYQIVWSLFGGFIVHLVHTCVQRVPAIVRPLVEAEVDAQLNRLASQEDKAPASAPSP